jgi:hypothetical protein
VQRPARRAAQRKATVAFRGFSSRKPQSFAPAAFSLSQIGFVEVRAVIKNCRWVRFEGLGFRLVRHNRGLESLLPCLQQLAPIRAEGVGSAQTGVSLDPSINCTDAPRTAYPHEGIRLIPCRQTMSQVDYFLLATIHPESYLFPFHNAAFFP